MSGKYTGYSVKKQLVNVLLIVLLKKVTNNLKTHRGLNHKKLGN